MKIKKKTGKEEEQRGNKNRKQLEKLKKNPVLCCLIPTSNNHVVRSLTTLFCTPGVVKCLVEPELT